MSEEKALGIQLIRECILNYITSLQDLKNVSLLNREWYADVSKRLVPICFVRLDDQDIIKYTDKIKEPIIKGKYICLTYMSDPKEHGYSLKFTKAMRAKSAKRLPLLESRITELWMVWGKSITPLEIRTLLKSCRNATYIYWNVKNFVNTENLIKLFEEVKNFLETTDLRFSQTKTLSLDTKSDIAWNFWADVFIHYFPNLEKLKLWQLDDNGSKFFQKLDNMGILQTLPSFSCPDSLNEEIWNRFLEKSCRFTKLSLTIPERDIYFFGLFLDKYQHQIENLQLHISSDIYKLRILPMDNLKKIGMGLHFDHEESNTEPLEISQNKDAYPKLREIDLIGYHLETLMVYFRNFSKNSGVSARVQKTTATLYLDPTPYFELIESGQDIVLLKELNQIFPNANNKIIYDKQVWLNYPDYESYIRSFERNGRRCVIS